VEVEVCRSEELDWRRGLTSELDDMWSDVRCKANPRWLWHAIDHHTGKVLAYVFGRRKDDVFLRLHQLLEPFGIMKFYTDGWGAYERHLEAAQHQVGKEHTQKIESKHINLRVSIMGSATLCFSRWTQRCGRQLHRCQYCCEYRPRLLPEKALRCRGPVRACEEKVVNGGEALALARQIEASQLMAA